MKLVSVFLFLLTLSACGGLKFFSHQNSEREIASEALKRLTTSSDLTFSDELDEKFMSLHAYSIISQKLLMEFDSNLEGLSLNEIYQSSSYLGLLAVKAQIDDIESELNDIYQHLGPQEKAKTLIFLKKLKEHGEKSQIAEASFSHLNTLLGLAPYEDIPSQKEIEAEYAELSQRKDFVIYEKNIEHLSHMFEVNIKSSAKTVKPSLEEEGNMTGEELPSKVWSLTFNNSPSGTGTSEILKNLKAQNLKATFFVSTEKLKENESSIKAISQEMEVALNSFSNKDLSKVGGLTLEREIEKANRDLKSNLKKKVTFIRLPYGSGVNVPAVRSMIVNNNLIHVLWNIDTLDWPTQSAAKIIERTRLLMKKSRHDSGIILFHDLNSRSVKASLEIMKDLKTHGRRVCTLGKIVKDINQGVSEVCSQKSF